MYKNSSGISLIAVVLSLTLLALGILGGIQILELSLRGSRSANAKTDFSLIKQTLARFDCRASLGVTSSTTLPLSCSSFSTVTLRYGGGTAITTSGKLGAWDVGAKCDGNEVIISLSRAGEDPLTKKPWGQVVVDGVKIEDDLFSGVSDFCREYFDTSTSGCPTTHPYFVGRNAFGKPNCCRKVTGADNIFQTPNHYASKAECAANEYVHYAGAQCPYGGESKFLHYADLIPKGETITYFGVNVSNGAVADCFGSTHSLVNQVHHGQAVAIATCCLM